MRDFKNFKEYLMSGNSAGLRNNMRVGFVNKIVDEDGQYPIHVACAAGYIEIVKLLLDYNCNIEFENEWGMKPIHSASKNGNTEIVKLLLKRKCQIDSKDILGNSPLDWATMCNKTDCIELLRIEELFAAINQNNLMKFDEFYKPCDFAKQNISTGLSILETAIKYNAYQIIKCILDKPANYKEINDLIEELTMKGDKNLKLTEECILYLCIIHQHAQGFKKFVSPDIINGQCKLVGLSFLEIATGKGCNAFIDGIMKKTIYNKLLWQNAILEAQEKGFVEIEEELSERMILLESRQKVNFTILHTAICDNDAEMVKYIVNHPNAVDLNSNNETFGTALSLGHSLHHRKCIKVLQQYKLNTNTRNKYSQTPLHEAIASGSGENCEYLIEQAIDIDWAGFIGLTALHCAVIRGMETVCLQLLNKGADYVRFIELSHRSSSNEIAIPFIRSIIPLTNSENALTFSMKFHRTLFSCFLNRLDSQSSNVHDGDKNSLLHLAVKCLRPGICKSLLKAGANVDSVNYWGNSPLLEMFCKPQSKLTNKSLNKMIIITNILIKHGANINAISSNGITVFQFASIIESENLMLALLSNNPDLNFFSSSDFQTAFTKQWFNYAEILINILPETFLASNITLATFDLSTKADTKLIKLLFDKSSCEMQQAIIEKLLCDAVNSDDIDLFEHFLKTEILVPKILKTGENLFTFILKENKVEFAWKLLNSINQVKFVNLKNSNNQIPLQLAIELEEMDLVDTLIHESDELDCEDAAGKTVLTRLMLKISNLPANHKPKMISVIKSAILLGADIYKMTSNGQRIIDACTESHVKAEIERFHKNNVKKSKIKNDNERGMCNICTDNLVNIVFQCGHLCCSVCADRVRFCPLCKAEIITRTKMYLI